MGLPLVLLLRLLLLLMLLMRMLVLLLVVYIELPEEDEGRDGGRKMGLLNKAMYGLRDAPQVWQQEVRRILGGMGFQESITSPCVYVNAQSGVRVVTHVDDFLCVGPRRSLELF